MMFAQIKLYIYGGVLVAFLLLAGYAKYLLSQNNNLHTQLEQMNVFVETQNSAMGTLKKSSDERLKLAAGFLEQAKKLAATSNAKSIVIYKTAPSTPGDSCKSALDLVNTK